MLRCLQLQLHTSSGSGSGAAKPSALGTAKLRRRTPAIASTAEIMISACWWLNNREPLAEPRSRRPHGSRVCEERSGQVRARRHPRSPSPVPSSSGETESPSTTAKTCGWPAKAQATRAPWPSSPSRRGPVWVPDTAKSGRWGEHAAARPACPRHRAVSPNSSTGNTGRSANLWLVEHLFGVGGPTRRRCSPPPALLIGFHIPRGNVDLRRGSDFAVEGEPGSSCSSGERNVGCLGSYVCP